MTNILQNFTQHRKEKIAENILIIGNPTSFPIITSNTRNNVRGVLSGFGIPSEIYLPASLSQLQDVYNSLATNYLGFVPLLLDILPEANMEDMEQAIRALNFRHICSFEGNASMSVVASIPSTAEVQVALSNAKERKASQPKQQEPVVIVEDVYAQAVATKPVNTANAQEAATKAIADLIASLSSNNKAELDEGKVVELIKKHSMATEIRIVSNAGEVKIPTGLHHKLLPDVLMTLGAGINVYLVGQAGAGKTTMAIQIAKALELPFYFNGALDSEYKLTGFMDAQGRYVRTAFRDAYERGGLYLFDELDASSASALLAFNAALENGHSDFPDGSVVMHKDFKCIAAANTYGTGADRVYIGRNQLDGAFLDRFAFIEMAYDEKLERALAGNDEWCDYVISIRKAIKSQKIRHIVSPRASIKGAALLAAGLSKDKVEKQLVWKGLDSDTITKIKSAA